MFRLSGSGLHDYRGWEVHDYGTYRLMIPRCRVEG